MNFRNIYVLLLLDFFIDSLIPGNKGTLYLEKKKRKIDRIEQPKGFIIKAIPNLIAALICIVN